MSEVRRSRATEAFYGRRHGRPLSPLQMEAVDGGLSLYGLDLATPAPDRLSDIFPVATKAVRLEIGFGGGEHLLHRAVESPDTGFIGVEPFFTGMGKLMASLALEPLPNIRVYNDDATRLLDWLPAASLAGIDLLYPDPWPKKKHWKRRFVSRVNLDRFARVIEPGGRFRFASDIDTYVNWTLLHCRAHPDFEWAASDASDWREPYANWPGTRYEAKALREGRTPAYLTFFRR